MDFYGKVAVVTGAQAGLGAEFARAFGRKGARVVLNYLDDGLATESVAEEICGTGGVATAIQADVSSRQDVEAMFAAIDGLYGSVDILVNNAGIFPRVAFLDMTEEQWETVIDVNLKGAFLCAQAAARRMVASGQGAIINISSGAAQGVERGVHYASSKGGLISLTRAMALELARFGIRVNTVAPGHANTAQPRLARSEEELMAIGRQLPLGRIAEPDDIAGAVTFLASDDARYITGQTLHVNGGGFML